MWSFTSANDPSKTVEGRGDNTASSDYPGDAGTAEITPLRGPCTDTATYDPVTRTSSTWGPGETEAFVATVEIAATGADASLRLAPCSEPVTVRTVPGNAPLATTTECLREMAVVSV